MNHICKCHPDIEDVKSIMFLYGYIQVADESEIRYCFENKFDPENTFITVLKIMSLKRINTFMVTRITKFDLQGKLTNDALKYYNIR